MDACPIITTTTTIPNNPTVILNITSDVAQSQHHILGLNAPKILSMHHNNQKQTTIKVHHNKQKITKTTATIIRIIKPIVIITKT